MTKVSALNTKTLTAPSPDALDAAIANFVQVGGSASGGIREQQLVSLHFSVASTTPPTYAVLIVYTS